MPRWIRAAYLTALALTAGCTSQSMPPSQSRSPAPAAASSSASGTGAPSSSPAAGTPAPAAAPAASAASPAGTAMPAATAAPVAVSAPDPAPAARPAFDTAASAKEALNARYAGRKPKLWGERVPGVMNRFVPAGNDVALTFDACGGPTGSGYDGKLIDYLIREKIPATLFINSRWIDANKETFLQLANNPLFEIEDHGTEHLPLSVTGKEAYGIAGTRSIGEVVDEVLGEADRIETLTGRRPRYFRSGTAYYDEIAASIVGDLGFKPVNFSVLGDAGATYTAEQVKKAMLTAVPGSIIIGHMNHPEKDTAEGVMAAIPEMKKKGIRFVTLDGQQLLE